MHCLGYSGFWTHCPTPLVGLLPFERTMFDGAAAIVTIVALAFMVLVTTLMVWRMTDGLAMGSRRQLGGRDETIVRTRRHVAACRSHVELVRRAQRYQRAGEPYRGSEDAQPSGLIQPSVRARWTRLERFGTP